MEFPPNAGLSILYSSSLLWQFIMLLPPQITHRFVSGAIVLKIPSLLSLPGPLLNDPSLNTARRGFPSAIFLVASQIFCIFPEHCLPV